MKATNTTMIETVILEKIPTNGDADVNEIKKQVYALLAAKSFKGHRNLANVESDLAKIKGFENDVYTFLEVAEVVSVEVDELLETIQEAITDLRFEKREIEFWIRENAKITA